jgi:hypothetical protein
LGRGLLLGEFNWVGYIFVETGLCDGHFTNAAKATDCVGISIFIRKLVKALLAIEMETGGKDNGLHGWGSATRAFTVL